MGEIRFIHTADLHLDSPFQGLQHMPTELYTFVRESTFVAFERLIKEAIERNVDFVLIVGDLFDGEDRSIKAQARLKRQMEKLHKAGIHAFIVHGNHDHLNGKWTHLEMPDNVHIWNDKVEMIPFTTNAGLKVHLYGFSYPTRHVLEKKITEYEKIGDADFHIGLLHGHCESGNSSHQPYAPFTINELLEKDMDYWALGHIHTNQILHKDPYIIYPGNIQGRHRKEQGDKGCYEVTISSDRTTRAEFISAAPILWESYEILGDEKTTISSIYDQCIKHMEYLMHKERSMILEINLSYKSEISNEIQQKIKNGELLEILQDARIEDGENYIWVNTFTLHHSGSRNLRSGGDFLKMLNEVSEELDHDSIFEEAISGLYSHIYASRYLSSIDENERKQMIEMAKGIIIDQLGGVE